MNRLLALADAYEFDSKERSEFLAAAGYSADEVLPLQVALGAWADPDFLALLYGDAAAAFDAGEYRKARTYAEAIVSSGMTRNPRAEETCARANLLLSKVANLQGDSRVAIVSASRAFRIAERLGHRFLVVDALQASGAVFHKVGIDDRAIDYYSEAWNRLHPDDPRDRSLGLMRDLATAHINLRDFDQVNEWCQDGMRESARAADERRFRDFWELYGRALASSYRFDAAARQLLDLRGLLLSSIEASAIEQVRVAVDLLRVEAFRGDVEESVELGSQIYELATNKGLEGQIGCIRTIASQASDYRDDRKLGPEILRRCSQGNETGDSR